MVRVVVCHTAPVVLFVGVVHFQAAKILLLRLQVDIALTFAQRIIVILAMLISANGAYVPSRVLAVCIWSKNLARVDASLATMALFHVLIRCLVAEPMSVIRQKLRCSYADLVRPKIFNSVPSIQRIRVLAVKPCAVAHVLPPQNRVAWIAATDVCLAL